VNYSFSQPYTKIRLAINFIVDENGNDAFTEYGCTLNNQNDCPNPDYSAFDFAKDLINKANVLLSCNAPSNLGEYNQQQNGWIFKTDSTNLYGDWFDPNFEMPPVIDVPFRYELARVNVYYRDCGNNLDCKSQFVSGNMEDELYADEMDASKKEFPVFIFPNDVTKTLSTSWVWYSDEYVTGSLSYVFGDKSGCNLDYVNLFNHEIGHQLAMNHGDDFRNYQDPDGNVDNDAYALEPCFALELSLKNMQNAGIDMDNYYDSLAPYQQERIDWCYTRGREKADLKKHFEDGRDHSNDAGVMYDEHPTVTQITTFRSFNFDIADFANNVIDVGVGWFYPLGLTQRNIDLADNQLNGNSYRFNSDYPNVHISNPLNNTIMNDGLNNSTLRRISGIESVNVSNEIDLQQPANNVTTVVELISERKILFVPGAEIIPDENSYLCAYIDPLDHFNSVEPVNETDCLMECNYNWQYEDYWNRREVFNGNTNNEILSRLIDENMSGMCETCQNTIDENEREGFKLAFTEYVENHHLRVYQDALFNYLSIEIHTNEKSSIESFISILDTNGKIVDSKWFTNKSKIEISKLPKGIYVVKVNVKDEILSQKFIKPY